MEAIHATLKVDVPRMYFVCVCKAAGVARAVSLIEQALFHSPRNNATGLQYWSADALVGDAASEQNSHKRRLHRPLRRLELDLTRLHWSAMSMFCLLYLAVIGSALAFLLL